MIGVGTQGEWWLLGKTIGVGTRGNGGYLEGKDRKKRLERIQPLCELFEKRLIFFCEFCLVSLDEFVLDVVWNELVASELA